MNDETHESVLYDHRDVHLIHNFHVESVSSLEHCHPTKPQYYFTDEKIDP